MAILDLPPNHFLLRTEERHNNSKIFTERKINQLEEKSYSKENESNLEGLRYYYKMINSN